MQQQPNYPFMRFLMRALGDQYGLIPNHELVQPPPEYTEQINGLQAAINQGNVALNATNATVATLVANQTTLQEDFDAHVALSNRREFNANARLFNLQPTNSPLAWLVNDEGDVPAMNPPTHSAILHMNNAAINAILGHYGLPVVGTLDARKIAVLRHLGKIL
jgi:hypothetical protein